MKKVSLSIIAVLLITIWSCEQENNIEEHDVKGGEDNFSINTKGGSRGLCRFEIHLEPQKCDPLDPTDCKCDPSGLAIGACAEIQCLPDVFNPITQRPILTNLCKIIKCDWVYNDPWILFYKADHRKFVSIRDVFKLNIKSNMQAIPFAMNESILGLQFYDKNDLMSLRYNDPVYEENNPISINYSNSNPEANIFYLKNSLTLDASYLKRLGLKGNVIKAGKYPVIFNKKNKTYNVILEVQKGMYE